MIGAGGTFGAREFKASVGDVLEQAVRARGMQSIWPFSGGAIPTYTQWHPTNARGMAAPLEEGGNQSLLKRANFPKILGHMRTDVDHLPAAKQRELVRIFARGSERDTIACLDFEIAVLEAF